MRNKTRDQNNQPTTARLLVCFRNKTQQKHQTDRQIYLHYQSTNRKTSPKQPLQSQNLQKITFNEFPISTRFGAQIPGERASRLRHHEGSDGGRTSSRDHSALDPTRHQVWWRTPSTSRLRSQLHPEESLGCLSYFGTYCGSCFRCQFVIVLLLLHEMFEIS